MKRKMNSIRNSFTFASIQREFGFSFFIVFVWFVLLSIEITENTAVNGDNQSKYDKKGKFHDSIN